MNFTHRTSIILSSVILLVCITFFSLSTSAQNDKVVAEPQPIKVLLITGGGWHDYKNQEVILRETITSRLNAVVDVKWTSTEEHPVGQVDKKIPHVFTTDFAKGYDVVLHNHCHVGFQNDEVLDDVIQNHVTNKVGTIMIHGSFHSFMRTKKQAWDRLCGCNSVRHEHHSALDVNIVNKEHPLTKGLGLDGWKTVQGELYDTKLNDTTISLAEGTTIHPRPTRKPKNGKPVDNSKAGEVYTDSCVFTHSLEGNPMVGITLGHHNSTMEQEEYKKLLSYAVLYTARKLNEDGTVMAGYLK